MRDRQGRTVTRKSHILGSLWILMSVVLSGLLGCLIGAAMRPQLYPSDAEVGQIVGASLALGLVLWLVTRFAFLDEASNSHKAAALVMIPTAAVIGGPIGAGIIAE